MPARRSRDIPTDSVYRRLRWYRRATWCLVLLVLLLAGLAVLDRSNHFRRHHADDWETYDRQPALVTAVTDGDTVTIRPLDGDPPAKVRLIGIDAPELRGENGKPAHWAAAAKDYLQDRVRNGQSVTVRLEETKTRDRYQRLLAYLYLRDSENLNLELVREGHAYADRRFSHSLRPQFEQAENDARRRERGLWQDVTDGKLPPWRRKWLEERKAKRRDRR